MAALPVFFRYFPRRGEMIDNINGLYFLRHVLAAVLLADLAIHGSCKYKIEPIIDSKHDDWKNP